MCRTVKREPITPNRIWVLIDGQGSVWSAHHERDKAIEELSQVEPLFGPWVMREFVPRPGSRATRRLDGCPEL